MDKLIYVAVSGSQRAINAQGVHANNLANVDTVGFKSDFAQVMARVLPGQDPNAITRVYAEEKAGGVNFDGGPLMTTGRDLDVAIQGKGWIAVEDSQGRPAMTRVGNLTLDGAGMLRTRAGHPVLGNAGPIALPSYENLTIGVDGTLSIRASGQGPESLTVVDRLLLVNPDEKNLVKGGDGLFRLNTGSFPEPDAGVRVISGALEGSNVNAVEEMMSVVSLARQFELQVKMMKKAEELDQSSARIMHMD